MSLGTDVGLGPDDIVLDGDLAPPSPKKGTGPKFSAHVYCGETAVCIRIPLGTEVGLSLLRHFARWGPSSPSKGAQPQFSANVH